MQRNIVLTLTQQEMSDENIKSIGKKIQYSNAYSIDLSFSEDIKGLLLCIMKYIIKSSITIIYLSNTNLDDDDIQYLSTFFTKKSKITHLDISENKKITNKSFNVLKKMIEKSSLIELTMNDTGIDDMLLNELVRCQMRKCRVYSTRW